MPFAGVVAASCALVFLLVLWASPLCHGAGNHNITAILAANPDFTEFNAALNSTGLAAEIDSRATLTILAVNNPVMAALIAQRLPQDSLHRVLSMNVLLDYFDAAKLHSLHGGFALATSLYQSSGQAQESAGLVNITAHRGGRVAFAPYGTADVPPAVFYQKSIHESPYDIAVLQVSALIFSPAAEAKAPAPPPEASSGLTDLMSKNGCGGFAGLVTGTADAAETYQKSVDGGLTIFCPADKAVAAFNPTFKNLTVDSQLAILLYHGVAAHYSDTALKSINGEVNTLATDGAKSYNLTIRDDGDTVKLTSSSRGEARVTKTVVDKPPLAIYLTDAVLLPRELLNGSGAAPSPAPVSAPAPVPVPAPTPAPARAPSPKRHPAPPPKKAHAPAPTPYVDQPPADEGGQPKNGASGTASWSLGAAVAAAVPAAVLVLW